MGKKEVDGAWWDPQLSIVMGSLRMTPAQRISLKTQLGLSEAARVETYKTDTGNDGVTTYGHDGTFQGDYEIKRLDDGGLGFKGIKGAEFAARFEHGDVDKLARNAGISASGEHSQDPGTLEMGHSAQARGSYGTVEIREGTIDHDGSSFISTEKTEIAGFNLEASAKVALQKSDNPDDFFGITAKGGVFGPSYERSVSKLTALTPNGDEGFTQDEYSAKVSLESGLGGEFKLSPEQFTARISDIIGAGVAAGIATRTTIIPKREAPEDEIAPPEVLHADPSDPSIVTGNSSADQSSDPSNNAAAKAAAPMPY